MKKFLSIVLLSCLLISCFSMTSCGVKKVEKQLQGTWEYRWFAAMIGEYSSIKYIFEDGYVTKIHTVGDSVYTHSGTYTITDSEIEIALENETIKLSYTYERGKLSLVYYGDGTVCDEYIKID